MFFLWFCTRKSICFSSEIRYSDKWKREYSIRVRYSVIHNPSRSAHAMDIHIPASSALGCKINIAYFFSLGAKRQTRFSTILSIINIFFKQSATRFFMHFLWSNASKNKTIYILFVRDKFFSVNLLSCIHNPPIFYKGLSCDCKTIYDNYTLLSLLIGFFCVWKNCRSEMTHEGFATIF